MSEAQRNVVVTGGAGGIGRATCLRLARDGHAVGVWDLDGQGAEDLAAQIRSQGGRAAGAACDVSDRASVDAARERTQQELGVISGLVSNAGIDKLSLFHESDPAHWRRILDVNLVGALNVAHALLPAMIGSGGGRIVCISSDAARVGSTGEAVYAAAKAGLLGFVKTLARETARHGIAVNAICPGPTDTNLLELVRNGPKGDRIIEGMARAIPMGRIGQPTDIAGVVAFFLSHDAGYVTGQVLSVSGGLTMAG
ncbi:MAG TPA: SDR family NAD(P)-dependent oxidoreductase [Candidatus Binatia bacterium]|nr:SDR family NAD(P)-dependent oxidoreductase [Candidatus Binatia bacterium]